MERNLRGTCDRSVYHWTPNIEQLHHLQPISFVHAVSLLPCLTTFSLTCHPRSEPVSTCQRGIKSFVVLIDEGVFTPRGRLAIQPESFTSQTGLAITPSSIISANSTTTPCARCHFAALLPPSLYSPPAANYRTLPNPSAIGAPARPALLERPTNPTTYPQVCALALIRQPRGISCRGRQHLHSARAANSHHGRCGIYHC